MVAFRNLRGKVAQLLRDLKFQGLTSVKGRPNAIWHARKAWEQIGRKDWREAIFFAQTAIACDPALYTGYLLLGLAYRLSGETEEARKALEQGLRTAPDEAQVYGYMGDLETQLGRWPEAEAAYRRALSMLPDQPEWMLHLAIALGKQDNLADANVLIERAHALSPGNIEILGILGKIRLSNGKFEDAEALLREAIHRAEAPHPQGHAFVSDSFCGELRFWLAHTLWQLDRRQEALAEARRAAELNPEDRSYQELVDSIKSKVEGSSRR